MANFFETSFVPQQSLTTVSAGERRREPVNIALIVSLILFFVALSVAGGMYIWKDNLVRSVSTEKQKLVDKEKNFDINKINTYKSLQTNLRNAKTLVDDHIVFSVLLNSIEKSAAKNIGLTSLGFATEQDGAALTLAGQAPDYQAVYAQVVVWRGMQPLFKSVEVTSLSLSEDTGIVNFTAKIPVDTKSLGFARYIAGQQVPTETITSPKIPIATATSSSIEDKKLQLQKPTSTPPTTVIPKTIPKK